MANPQQLEQVKQQTKLPLDVFIVPNQPGVNTAVMVMIDEKMLTVPPDYADKLKASFTQNGTLTEDFRSRHIRVDSRASCSL